MMKKILWLIAAICFAQTAFAQEVNSGGKISGYLIGPGDVIEGKVMTEDQFNFTATVDENGNIEVPFFDKPVRAICRTESDLRVEVTKLVARYIRNPLVSVQVKERKSRPPATVYGEVRQPQQVILTRKATLRELLAFSGGVTKEASGMVQVTRTQPLLCSEKSDEDWKTISDNGLGFPSRLYSLNSLKDVNPEIYPGDVIDVQKAAPVYVVGEVVKPGEMYLPEGGLPMMQAIAMAGGATREAQKKEIKVYRRKEGTSQPEVIVVNYEQVKKGQNKDLMLEPFDIVEVGKSKKSIGDIFLEALTGIPNRVPIPIRPF